MTENKSNSALDAKLKASLNNTAWQKGLTWRSEKVNAVAEARRRGISEEEIFKQLKIAGLIDATAKAIMKDASYLEDSEMPQPQESEQIKCAYCGNDITEQVNSGQEYFQYHGLKFCNKICYDRFLKKREKEDTPHG
jgi:hypothetical protein